MYQKADTFGSKMENGSWNGVMQMVMSNEVHVGVGDFTITAERSAVVDFLAPLLFSRSVREAWSRSSGKIFDHGAEASGSIKAGSLFVGLKIM